MMKLTKCVRIFGEAVVLPALPSVTTYHDVLLDHWTLYDKTSRVIPDSGFYQGIPKLELIGDPGVTSYNPRQVSRCMPNENFFWLGPIHPHFGHFLISTLARAWALLDKIRPDTPIAYIGPPVERLFEVGYIRDCFNGLNIGRERLVAIHGPMRFPCITVAEPALIENHSIYKAYFDMLRTVSGRLLDDDVPSPGKNKAPVYISKERVRSGVKTILNEAELSDELKAYGVEIAFPDTLSFREQLEFWAKEDTIFGFASSAFHVTAFFGRKRLCTISDSLNASSNQVLLDLVSGNANLHVHPVNGLVPLGKTKTFSASLAIKNPKEMAKDIVRLMEECGRGNGFRPQRFLAEPRSLSQRSYVSDPFGVNLALKGKTRQSSTYQIQEGYNCDSSGAISGKLTGHYQCHTTSEAEPWWQVELPTFSAIYEIRVFNRCDNLVAQARLNQVCIRLSPDGITWTTLFERQETELIGGQQGEPYRWLADSCISARFVRLQIPGHTFLHLDQVEVFGEPVEAIWME